MNTYKNYFVITAIFVILFAFQSCFKDRMQSPLSDSSYAQSSEREEEDLQFHEFTLNQNESFSDGRQAIAFAFSKEMAINPDFRTLLYAQLQPNEYRFKELHQLYQIIGILPVQLVLLI
jgi:hypothetical protein